MDAQMPPWQHRGAGPRVYGLRRGGDQSQLACGLRPYKDRTGQAELVGVGRCPSCSLIPQDAHSSVSQHECRDKLADSIGSARTPRGLVKPLRGFDLITPHVPLPGFLGIGREVEEKLRPDGAGRESDERPAPTPSNRSSGVLLAGTGEGGCLGHLLDGCISSHQPSATAGSSDGERAATGRRHGSTSSCLTPVPNGWRREPMAAALPGICSWENPGSYRGCTNRSSTPGLTRPPDGC